MSVNEDKLASFSNFATVCFDLIVCDPAELCQVYCLLLGLLLFITRGTSTTSHAIETLGGTEGIVKARSSETLELHFCPEDTYSHPVIGRLHSSGPGSKRSRMSFYRSFQIIYKLRSEIFLSISMLKIFQ